MSYEVIARKWRPRAFSELVGQDHISQTLLNALKNNRLPHALLFTGPRGTGKTSSARILAKALRCPNTVDFAPCNECSDCLDIAAGSSVNVIEIDGASNNGVEAIRELRDSVGYMPSSGKYKVYIIDEVHMLSTSAFNALLKTLEEPPPHVIFIMATTEVQKIPNTILSRCQRFDFRRISLRLVSERLEKICASDGVTADNEALWMIARQGDGSMRDAQSLLDQVITFSDQHITLEKVVNVLGLTDRSLLITALEALATRDAEKTVSVINNIFRSGYDPKVFMQDLLEEIRHFLLIKLSPKNVSDVIDLPEAEVEHLLKLSEPLSAEDIHLLFDMALKGSHDLPKSQDPRIVLEMLLLRMSQAPRICDLVKLTQQVKKKSTPIATTPLHANNTAKQKVSSIDAPRRQPATPSKTTIKNTPKETTAPQTHIKNKEALTKAQPSVSQPVAQPTKEKENIKPQVPSGDNNAKWTSLVNNIKKKNGLMGAQLENTYLAEFEQNILKIGVSPKVTFLAEKLKTPEFKRNLEGYIKMFWGQGFQFEVIHGENKKSQKLTPKALAEQKKRDQLDSIRRQVEAHPLMQETNKNFKTQIKSIKEMKS